MPQKRFPSQYTFRKSVPFRVWDGAKMWQPGVPGYNLVLLPDGRPGRIEPPPTKDQEVSGNYDWEDAEVTPMEAPHYHIMLRSPYFGHEEGATELEVLYEGDIVRRVDGPARPLVINLYHEAFFLLDEDDNLHRATPSVPLTLLGNIHEHPGRFFR